MRLAGALSIVAGATIVGFSPNRWDVVVLDLPRGHGIHSHDLLGMVLVVLGITLMWLREPT